MTASAAALEFGLKAKPGRGIKRIQRDLRKVRKMQRRAAMMALNDTGRDVERAAVASVAEDARVPKGQIRHHHDLDGIRTGKRRLLLIKATREALEVGIAWLPQSRDPRIKLGTLRPYQSRRGVRAKAHRVPGGFVPEAGAPKYGRKRGQVFRRVGEARYPIELQTIALREIGDRAFGQRLARSGRLYRRNFDRHMRRLLSKARPA